MREHQLPEPVVRARQRDARGVIFGGDSPQNTDSDALRAAYPTVRYLPLAQRDIEQEAIELVEPHAEQLDRRVAGGERLAGQARAGPVDHVVRVVAADDGE